MIARRVSESLGFPEIGVRSWHYLSEAAVMHMKETAVYIDYLSMSHKNHVWFAGKIFLVKSISIAHSMDNRSNDHFRSGVAISNTRHVEPSLLWRVNVSHGRRCFDALFVT
jgi:hypothetical protein